MALGFGGVELVKGSTNHLGSSCSKNRLESLFFERVFNEYVINSLPSNIKEGIEEHFINDVLPQ